MELKLVFPSDKFEKEWIEIVEEIEKTDEIIVPYSLSYRQHDFHVFLKKTEEAYKGINLGKFVPASTYFLVDDKEDRIYGAVNIRHSLNEDLLLTGGHIGYGIRPSERRKGYAARMLALALEECKKLEINKVLVTCDRDNIGSARTIQNNGGILENEVKEDDGNIVQRYWIDLLLES